MTNENNEVEVTNHRDVILILNNGTRLITRLILDVTDEDDQIIEDEVFMYEPYELVRINDGRLVMTKWIPETTDLIVPLPLLEIMTQVNPDDGILKHYLQSIQVLPPDEDEQMPSKSVH